MPVLQQRFVHQLTHLQTQLSKRLTIELPVVIKFQQILRSKYKEARPKKTKQIRSASTKTLSCYHQRTFSVAYQAYYPHAVCISYDHAEELIREEYRNCPVSVNHTTHSWEKENSKAQSRAVNIYAARETPLYTDKYRFT